MLSDSNAPSRRALTFIFATVFLDLLGAGILLPVIPYLVEPYRGDALTVGLLALAFSAAQFIASPILGVLSDRHGRRPVLLASIFGSALGYILFGIGGSLAVFYASRLLDGFSGGNISTAQAFIADITPAKDRAKSFGLIGAAFGIGFIVGPAAGGLLAKISLQAPAWAAAALALATTVFGYFALPESLPPERRRAKPLTLADLNPFATLLRVYGRDEVRTLLLAVFAFNFATSGMQSNFPVFTRQRFSLDAAQTGLILAWVGVMAAIVQGGLVRKLAPRFGERRLALAGLLITAASFDLFAFVPWSWALYPAAAVCATGVSFTNPALVGLISQRGGGHEQGLVLGAMTAMASLARVGGPLWAGAIFDWAGPGAPYWTGALWLLAGYGMVRRS